MGPVAMVKHSLYRDDAPQPRRGRGMSYYDDNADLRMWSRVSTGRPLPHEWRGFGPEQAEAGGYQSVEEAVEVFTEILEMAGSRSRRSPLGPPRSTARGSTSKTGGAPAPPAGGLRRHRRAGAPRAVRAPGAGRHERALMVYMLVAELFSRRLGDDPPQLPRRHQHGAAHALRPRGHHRRGRRGAHHPRPAGRRPSRASTMARYGGWTSPSPTRARMARWDPRRAG